MATATKKKSTRKPASKPAPEPELEVDEELDETEADEAPAKSKSQEVTFGASDLARHLSETSGKAVSARELRTLIRKMARDGSGRVTREITPGNRTRYNWSGVNDPEVKAIIKAFNAGELEADKKEKLDALKARKAEKKAKGEPVGKKAKKGKKSKPAAAPVVEDDDEELEFDEDE